MAMQVLQSFQKALTLTKSDSVNSPQFGGRYPDVIWVGEAGVVVLVFGDGSVVPFTCAAGTILPVQAQRINSTNTVGTLFVGLWQA